MISAIREERIKAGLCVDCGINAAVPGKIKCGECLEATALYSRPRHKKNNTTRELDDVVRAAESVGLSYGRYVAQEYELRNKRSIPDICAPRIRGISTLQVAMVIDFPRQTRKARLEAIAMRQVIVSSFYKGMQPSEIAEAYDIEPHRILKILSEIAVKP